MLTAIWTRYKTQLIFLIFVGGFASAGYLYYKQSQTALQTLSAANAKLELALQTSEASVTRLTDEQTRLGNLLRKLQGDITESEVVIDDLRKLLNEHNLTRLAIAKPGLIERRMQEATNEVFDSINNDTANYRVQSIPNE